MSVATLDRVVPSYKFLIDHDKYKRFKDYRGQHLIVYFYPKDNTPGCSNQAQDFTKAIKKFTKLNTVILGVSRDSLTSHDKFKAKFNIPYDLIADEDETLCQAFDVIKLKNMYGKKVMGIERSTFHIDENGKLRKAWRKVKVKDHIKELLAYLDEINVNK